MTEQQNTQTEQQEPQTGPQPQAYETQCVACGSSLSAHFREQRWTGCPGMKRRVPTGMFVPVVMLVAPKVTKLVAPKVTKLATAAAQTMAEPVEVQSVEETEPSTMEAAPSKRGRRPSRYVVATVPDAPLAGALGKVFQIVSKRKRGVEARDVAEKLHMSPGTVGWALGKLIRIGHVQHAQPRTKRAA